ncbi:MAG: DUF5069 domain-containing protein [Candidatus Cybelea sp.]
MKPLNLTKTAPRSPREQLVGLVFIPRTIDKMRALLPGGNTGKYHVDGASLALLEQIGVDPVQFQELVASAASDADIAAWLQERADLSQCAGINERFLTIGPATASPENIENFVADLEPEIAESTYATFSEALDRDDVAYLKACATL